MTVTYLYCGYNICHTVEFVTYSRFMWFPSKLGINFDLALCSPSVNRLQLTGKFFAIGQTSSCWALFLLPSFNLTVRTTPSLSANVSIM